MNGFAHPASSLNINQRSKVQLTSADAARFYNGPVYRVILDKKTGKVIKRVKIGDF